MSNVKRVYVEKKADFAVLDKNPLSTEPDGIRDIKVLATIKEDQLIWKRQ